MKILYISSIDVSNTTGPAANEREFIPGLYKLIGDKSHFVIPKVRNSFPEDIPITSCSFTKYATTKSLYFWFLHQISIIFTVRKVLYKKKFDFIVMRAGVFPLAYIYVTRRYKIPYAMKTAGSGEFNVFKGKNIILKMFYGLNIFLYKSLVKRATSVDVVSPFQKKILSEVTGQGHKIIWIDNGVNENRFHPLDVKKTRENLDLERFNPIIGYVGNLPWERGALQIIEALPKLKEKYPNIMGLILGSGEKMGVLYSKAEELGVIDRCVFTGQVPFEEVVKYINVIDIGISQLFEKSQGASEQKVRQYLACGKPIIVSPGSVNSFVEEQQLGYIVDPYDKEAFLDAVDKILSLSEKEYDFISKKARNYAISNLSYESKIKERLSLYENLLKK